MKKHIKIFIALAVMLFGFTVCEPQGNKGKSIVIDTENTFDTVKLYSPEFFTAEGKYFQLMDCFDDKIVLRNNVSRESYVGFAERTTEIIVYNLSAGKTEFTYTVDGEDVLVFGALLRRDTLYVSEFDIKTNYHNIYSYKNGVKTLIAENIGNYVSQFGPSYNPLVRTADGVFFEDQRYIGDDFIYKIMKADADGYSEYHSRNLLTFENAPYGLTVTADGKLSYIIENSNNKREYMQIVSVTEVAEKETTLLGYNLLSMGSEMLCIEKDGEESFYLKLRDKEGTELASLSLFGVGELTVITDTTGYLTITTYSQTADDDCYLYHYRYSDEGVVLTPVNYNTSFNFSTLVTDGDNTVILRRGKTGEAEKFGLYMVK